MGQGRQERRVGVGESGGWKRKKKPNKPTHTKTTTKIPTPLNKTEKKPQTTTHTEAVLYLF